MHDNKAKVIGVFIAGALLGATVASLCAPRSGARSRKPIRRQAGRRLEQLDELQDDFRNQVHNWVEDVTEVIEDGVGRGRKVTVVGRERVLGAFDQAKDYVEHGKSRIERLLGG
jgi:gas vesicle protein